MKKLPIRIVPFHNPKEPTRPAPRQNANTNGPPGAYLTYNGGQVISNVQVAVVYWGSNVSNVVTEGIISFYQTVVDSTYLDLMYEYSTVGVNFSGTTTNQKIGHGTVLGPYTIAPSISDTTISDASIQSELQAQIAAGHLPAVSTDADGNSNTLYTVYFPPGITITQGGTNSCQSGGFCAYHGTAHTTGANSPVFQYSVNPDFGPGSGCDTGCGNSSTEFGNITSVSSHELAESITDAQVGFAGAGNGPPLAWYDNTNGEIGDICNASQDTVSAHGKTFTIQQLWSNNQGACVSGPGASLTLTTNTSSAATGTDLSLTVTVKNSQGVTLPFYTGTIHFTSSDTSATLPADYTFTDTDGGTHTFNINFGTTGSQSVTATDADVSSIHGSVTETVTQGLQTPVITWNTPASITYGTALGPAQLNATANVSGSFSYNPAAGAILPAGTHQLQATFTPTDTSKYKTTTAAVNLQVNEATPTINWSTPAPITYGTALSGTQLNAAANTAGSFVYTPAAGTILTAGAQTLKVTFTPNDTANYTSASATVVLQVNQAAPTINWPTPAPITYGTALTTSQLNASSTVPGSFVYTPAAGTVLTAGAQTLKVTLTPNDTANYTSARAAVVLQVNQVTPTINWPTPAPITYGTPLSGAQLNATANVSGGTFSYSPPANTVLSAGKQTLMVSYTPADSVNYAKGTASVTLQVNQATPSISWATPAPITYGTPLGSAQLNAVANVAGSYTYSPTANTVLPAGAQTLKVAFTPSDTTDYTNATYSVTLQVTDFAITASPGSQTVPSGHDATYSLVLNSIGGSAGTVALGCSGGPPNSSCTISPASINLNGSGNATMTVQLHPPINVNHGTFTLTIAAQSGNDVHTVSVSLTVK